MRTRPFAVLALSFLLACGGSGAPEGSDGPTTSSTPAAGAVPTSDWRSYAEPTSEEWPETPLDDERWVAAAADLGCVGRAHHGDEDGHRAAMRRVLAHHGTNQHAVMEYGIAINAGTDPKGLGKQVADRVAACR